MGLIRIAVAAAIVFFGAPSSAQNISIRFDYSNADATLAVFSRTDKIGIDQLVALPSTVAVIAKRATRDAKVNATLYEDSLFQVRAGEKAKYDPFQWQFCISEQRPVQALLTRLHDNESTIRARLAKALSPQIDPASSLTVTVHYVLGGVSAGWEEGASDFYIGLPFYKGDLEGIVWTMQHELFHNAQYIGFHDQAADLAQLNERQQEVYRFLDELYREGTATYVGDLSGFPPTTPFIKEMRDPAIKNADRMNDNFILLDTIAYRLAHDPSSHFDELRSLGFDWDWQNRLYYAGEYMAGVLAKQQGNLRSYLKQPPTVFARDYITLCTAANKCSYPLSSATAAEILAIDKRLSKADPPK